MAIERCLLNDEGFIVVPIKPIGAVRLVASDRWAKRPRAVMYFDWKNEFKLIINQSPMLQKAIEEIKNIGGIEIISKHSLSESWSGVKKKELYGMPMTQKPDWDNVAKGILDLMFKEDSFIHKASVGQYWCDEFEKECIWIKPLE